MENEGSKRHPFRFLFKLLFFSGLVYLVGRFVARQKEEYSGLTESEAHTKLTDKISSKVGSDTATEIADQVIPKLKEMGVVKPDPMEEAANDMADAATDLVDAVEEKAENGND